MTEGGVQRLSAYECLNGGGARWYWDPRYLSEAAIEHLNPPLCPLLLLAIDAALDQRTIAEGRKREKV